MAQIVIVSWRDMPAQVIVRAGRQAAKRELPARFIAAIDRVAMRQGLAETADYLDQWRRGAPVPCGDDLEAEADRAAAEIDADYTPEKLRALEETGGYASPP